MESARDSWIMDSWDRVRDTWETREGTKECRDEALFLRDMADLALEAEVSAPAEEAEVLLLVRIMEAGPFITTFAECLVIALALSLVLTSD